MNDYMTDSKCLASLAVFRVLYNSEKDIYGIINEFLKEIIYTNGKHQFSLTEITKLLNSTYEFSIPEAVVKTALGKSKTSIAKTAGFYTVTDISLFSRKSQIHDEYTSIVDNHKVIIQNLFQFIEIENKIKLTETEKENVVQSFCSFIIDETAGQEYSEYISAFIVKCKKDTSLTKQLNLIKEGVVLYTGLKYNPNINDLGHWKNELTIYLDTEILFHFYGFNGLLFQSLFNDFFSLVKEINLANQKKHKKNLIHLKYFDEVKKEIEGFFKKAEDIVLGKESANPSKTAMTSIINGCKTPAEIIEKKIRFYHTLKISEIKEDDYDGTYYAKHNHKYNIIDKCEIAQLTKKHAIEDPEKHLKFLNYINIHRRGDNARGFENIGYVLLTGTSHTFMIAWDELLKPDGTIPLASNLNFLTNKFWFNLNKGLGKGNYPKTFDIVTKAQIVLSSQLNDSVADKFAELQVKSKSGDLTEEQAIATIVELRRQAKRPEEINECDVEDVLKSIEESSIEQYLQEQELFKDKAKKEEKENIKLITTLNEKEKEFEEKERQYQESLKQKEEEAKKKEVELEKFREKERKKNKRKKILKKVISVILVIGCIIIFIYYNNIFGKIISFIAAIFGILRFFDFNYNSFLRLIGLKHE